MNDIKRLESLGWDPNTGFNVTLDSAFRQYRSGATLPVPLRIGELDSDSEYPEWRVICDRLNAVGARLGVDRESLSGIRATCEYEADIDDATLPGTIYRQQCTSIGELTINSASQAIEFIGGLQDEDYESGVALSVRVHGSRGSAALQGTGSCERVYVFDHDGYLMDIADRWALRFDAILGATEAGDQEVPGDSV